MLYLGLSQCYDVIYPGRLPGGGKGEGIPVEEPYCKEGQILSQCRGVAAGQPSLCGWPDLPQHVLLLAAPFRAL